MSFFMKHDPAADAEAYYQAYRRDDRPVIGYCAECNAELHGSDDTWEEDDAFLFDNGDLVCGDCIRDYCNKHFRI